MQLRHAGCGVWYYRDSTSLTYLGRLEEALQYAEQGVVEEPGYPWRWLQLAGLRRHFGNRRGALDAVAQGLELVLGDYEFLRRREKILQGKNLAELENHCIDEETDRPLMEEGLDQALISEKRAASQAILKGPAEEGNKSKKKKQQWYGNAPPQAVDC